MNVWQNMYRSDGLSCRLYTRLSSHHDSRIRVCWQNHLVPALPVKYIGTYVKSLYEATSYLHFMLLYTGPLCHTQLPCSERAHHASARCHVCHRALRLHIGAAKNTVKLIYLVLGVAIAVRDSRGNG